jgi:hypothetical protein
MGWDDIEVTSLTCSGAIDSDATDVTNSGMAAVIDSDPTEAMPWLWTQIEWRRSTWM